MKTEKRKTVMQENRQMDNKVKKTDNETQQGDRTGWEGRGNERKEKEALT